MYTQKLFAAAAGTWPKLGLLLMLGTVCSGVGYAQAGVGAGKNADGCALEPLTPEQNGPANPAADDDELWKRLDITEDGWLDGKELEGGWKKYDANGDNEVTKAEFMAGRAKDRPQGGGRPSEEDVRLFKQLDVSKNGLLSGTELDAGNVRSYDTNGDGRVTEKEFMDARARLRQGDVRATPAAQADSAGELLTQSDILNFLSTRLGAYSANNPQREQAKKDLVEFIKLRGLDFRDEVGSDFHRQSRKYGLSSEISFTLGDNFGPPTRLNWLMGAWTLGKISAPVDFIKKDGLYRQNEFGVKDVGTLTLNPNGSYVWQYYAGTLRGAWRKATAAEMRTQGGDGVVLLKAKSDWDWIVMQNRTAKPKDEWISIKGLNFRTVRETGARKVGGR